MRTQLIDIYLDYLHNYCSGDFENNYLNYERYAIDNHLSIKQALKLIDLTRSIANPSPTES